MTQTIKKALSSSIYYSIYKYACSEAHNDISSLIKWNTELDDNKNFTIITNSQEKTNVLPYLDSLSAMFMNSNKKIDVAIGGMLVLHEPLMKYKTTTKEHFRYYSASLLKKKQVTNIQKLYQN